MKTLIIQERANASRQAASFDIKPWLLLTILAVAVAYIIGSVIMSFDKGIGFTDESFHLLAYHTPLLYPGLHCSSYHFVLSSLPKLCDNEVIHYRALCLLIKIIAPTILTVGFWKWLQCRVEIPKFKWILPSLILFTVCGGMLDMYHCFRLASYNDLTGGCLCAAAGLLFWSDSCIKPIRVHICALFAGAFFGLSLFSKVTSSALFLLYFLLALPAMLKSRRGEIVLYAALGVCMAIASYFLFVEDFSSWFRGMTLMIGMETAGSHNPGVLFFQAFERIAQNSRQLPLLLGSAVCLAFVGRLLRKTEKRIWTAAVVLSSLVAGAILLKTAYYLNYHIVYLCAGLTVTLGLTTIFQTCPLTQITMTAESKLWLALVVVSTFAPAFVACTFGYLNHPFAYFGAIDLAIFALSLSRLWSVSGVSALVSQAQYRRFIEIVCGFGLLLALPFMGAFGSDNDLLFQAVMFIAPLYLLIGAVTVVSARQHLAISLLAVMLPLIVCTIAQFYYGFNFHPFRMRPLSEQTRTIDWPCSLRGIKVDAQEWTYLRQFQTTLSSNGFQKGDPVLGFYDIPGAVYAVDGVSIGHPWMEQHPLCIMRNLKSVGQIQRSKIKRLFVVLSNTHKPDCLEPDMVQALNRVGIRFPEQFDKIGAIRNPEPFEDKGFSYIYALHQQDSSI